MIEQFIDELAEEMLNNFGFVETLKQMLLAKVAYDDSAWDGSAGRWDTPEAYCSDCLIDMNESGAEKTKDKCKLPYRHPGSSKINKGALRAMATGHGIPALQGVPAEQKRKAARWAIRHWKAAFGKEAPENLQRIAKGGSSFKNMFVKDLNGDVWFFGVYTNQFEDVEEEILSEASHKEYIQWVKETGFEPVVTVFHQPRIIGAFWTKVFDKYGNDGAKLTEVVNKIFNGFSFADVKRIMYISGMVVIAAKVRPDMLDVAERLAQEAELKMSHAFISLDRKGRVFNAYRSFEMSVLPMRRAANVFTLGSFIKGLMNMDEKNLSAEDRAWFMSVYGEEKGPALAEVMDDLSVLGNRLRGVLDFKDLGIGETEMGDEKEKELTPETEEEEEEVQPGAKQSEEEPTPEQKQDGEGMDEEEEEEDNEEETVKAVAAKVVEIINPQGLTEVISALSEQVKALTEKVDALEGLPDRVKDMEKTADEKYAEETHPINWSKIYNPSSADDNVMTDEEKAEAKANVPKAPQNKKPAGEQNMLELGFYSPLGLS